MRVSKISRYISIFLCVIYLTTQCLFANKPELNIWADRKKSSSVLSLVKPFPLTKAGMVNHPSNSLRNDFYSSLIPFGSIRRITNPIAKKTNGIVVHIQDIHMNLEAQNNISKAIRSLILKENAHFLGLEGAFGSIDLSRFTGIDNQFIVQKVAEYLLKGNQISGPVYTLLTTKNSLKVEGIDDKNDYELNVSSYKEANKKINHLKEVVAHLRQKIDNRKVETFNPKLYQFDQKTTAYRDGKLGTGEYSVFLSPFIPKSSNQLNLFLETIKLEKNINFEQVERERSVILEKLLKTLNPAEIDQLFSVSSAYRQDQINHGRFYEYLKKISLNAGIHLNHYPEMNRYINYILLSDQIDGEKVSSDIKENEVRIYNSLINNPLERDVVKESNRIFLVSKLIEFSLSREEWTEYQEIRNSAKHDGLKFELRPFEEFYRQAILRDEKMTHNFLKGVLGSPVSLLVTGGFHSSGIRERLVQKGYTVVEFVPKVSKVELKSGTSYLSVFSQQKTPLERLFEGKKLFLAQDPTKGILPAAAAICAILNPLSINLMGLLPGFAGHSAIVVKTSGNNMNSADVVLTNRSSDSAELIVSWKGAGEDLSISEVIEENKSPFPPQSLFFNFIFLSSSFYNHYFGSGRWEPPYWVRHGNLIRVVSLGFVFVESFGIYYFLTLLSLPTNFKIFCIVIFFVVDSFIGVIGQVRAASVFHSFMALMRVIAFSIFYIKVTPLVQFMHRGGNDQVLWIFLFLALPHGINDVFLLWYRKIINLWYMYPITSDQRISYGFKLGSKIRRSQKFYLIEPGYYKFDPTKTDIQPKSRSQFDAEITDLKSDISSLKSKIQMLSGKDESDQQLKDLVDELKKKENDLTVVQNLNALYGKCMQPVSRLFEMFSKVVPGYRNIAQSEKVSFIAVDAETELLTPLIFSSFAGWGFVTYHPELNTFFISARYLANLKSKKDFKSAQMILLNAWNFREKIKELEIKLENGSVDDYFLELENYKKRKREEEYREWGFLIQHFFLAIKDKFKVFKFRLKLNIMFLRFWFIGVKDEGKYFSGHDMFRIVEEIAASPEFFLGNSNELNREHSRLLPNYLRYRDFLDPLIREFNHLSNLDLSMGVYGITKKMIPWYQFMFVVDSGRIPPQSYVYLLQQLARYQDYESLYGALKELQEHKFTVTVPLTLGRFYRHIKRSYREYKRTGKGWNYFLKGLRRNIVIQLPLTEQTQVIDAFSGMKFHSWLRRVLTEQAAQSQLPEDREKIIQIRNESMDYLYSFWAKYIIGVIRRWEPGDNFFFITKSPTEVFPYLRKQMTWSDREKVWKDIDFIRTNNPSQYKLIFEILSDADLLPIRVNLISILMRKRVQVEFNIAQANGRRDRKAAQFLKLIDGVVNLIGNDNFWRYFEPDFNSYFKVENIDTENIADAFLELFDNQINLEIVQLEANALADAEKDQDKRDKNVLKKHDFSPIRIALALSRSAKEVHDNPQLIKVKTSNYLNGYFDRLQFTFDVFHKNIIFSNGVKSEATQRISKDWMLFVFSMQRFLTDNPSYESVFDVKWYESGQWFRYYSWERIRQSLVKLEEKLYSENRPLFFQYENDVMKRINSIIIETEINLQESDPRFNYSHASFNNPVTWGLWGQWFKISNEMAIKFIGPYVEPFLVLLFSGITYFGLGLCFPGMSHWGLIVLTVLSGQMVFAFGGISGIYRLNKNLKDLKVYSVWASRAPPPIKLFLQHFLGFGLLLHAPYYLILSLSPYFISINIYVGIAYLIIGTVVSYLWAYKIHFKRNEEFLEISNQQIRLENILGDPVRLGVYQGEVTPAEIKGRNLIRFTVVSELDQWENFLLINPTQNIILIANDSKYERIVFDSLSRKFSEDRVKIVYRKNLFQGNRMNKDTISSTLEGLDQIGVLSQSYVILDRATLLELTRSKIPGIFYQVNFISLEDILNNSLNAIKFRNLGQLIDIYLAESVKA